MTSNPVAPKLRLPQPLPIGPRQARSIEKRQRLLDSARVLFGENGYEETSIEAITRRAGMASGAFYVYFRSKRQLLVVLMQELVDRLGGLDFRPKASPDVREGLRGLLSDVFRTDLKYFGVIRAWQEASLADRKLGEMRTSLEAWTGTRIERVFQLLLKHPRARPDRDIRSFARMMDRHFWALLAAGATSRPRALEREIRTASDVIYHYLFADDGPGG